MESICFFTSIYTLYLYTLIWYTLCKHTSSTKTCNICIDNSIKVGQPMIQELYDQIVSNGKVHRGWRTLAVLNSYHSSNNNNKQHQQQKWNYLLHLLHLEWYQVYFDDRERFEHIRKRYCWVICWLILEMLLWTRVCKIERDSERNNCEAGCTALIKIIYKEKFQHGCRWLFFVGIIRWHLLELGAFKWQRVTHSNSRGSNIQLTEWFAHYTQPTKSQQGISL